MRVPTWFFLLSLEPTDPDFAEDFDLTVMRCLISVGTLYRGRERTHSRTEDRMAAYLRGQFRTPLRRPLDIDHKLTASP